MSGTLERMCPLDCPDTCSLDVTVEEGRVTRIDGNHKNPLTEGYICGKVRAYAEHVYHPTRLLHPLVRELGSKKGAASFRQASWDEALALIAARLRSLRDERGGESILPCYYGGSNGKFTQDSSDAALFRRLGASKMHRGLCAAATTAASVGLYGGMPGIPLPDYAHARLIVVWGTNPHATGIHFVPFVRRAQAAGAKLVVLDPRATKLALASDLHLALRPGTDLPLALALHRWLFETGRADLAFLARHARGADELRRRAAPWTIARAAEVCGLEPQVIERFARLYAETSPAALRCGWGPERNRNGCSAIAAILALPAVAGKFGVRGGGYTMSNGRAFPLNPVVAEPEPATRTINSNQLGRALLEQRDPEIAALFVYNANPLATFPDQERVRRGLAREDLFTVVFDQVMTDSARFADVVLPATTFLEHAELRNGYGALALQYAEASIEPLGEARANYAVFAELIERLGLARPEDDFTPLGMLRTVVGSDEAARALASDGIAFPPCGEHPVQFVDVFPRTSDQKIQLVPASLDAEGEQPLYAYRDDPADARHPLALISPATEKLISSSLGELLTRAQPLSIHPDDAQARGISEGDSVRIWNALGEVVTHAHLDPRLRPGVVQMNKGLWSHHTQNGATANALAPDTLTDRAGGACFNDARVEVARVGS
ncbi:MAG: molybdopterin-dependent oxidoreductase [Planctomycetes bacterium]|nr:molybdopterin-dependent oxidoreductase [Planctomycetota bacterium]